ncbi:glycosyl hydrolase [Aspergillus ambiguus]|uniref:glycosyl hydrolase n=1 Tax=Aspergillus ambiguus TaxID=176160 RepID=UPI003CCC9D06
MAVAQATVYSGDLRPQVHFSPPSGFMNDPNGLFYDDKNSLYHLYYQYNPTDIVAGNQHWGHATSADLYHWANQPIAISPSHPDEHIFSGSAVIDRDNTSGFFPNQTDGVVAIYTVDTPTAETQHIAYSRDGGYTFTKYAHNPVINSSSTDFRDPQVTWHAPSRRWVLAIAYAADRVIGFYTSPNLRDWTHASNFSQPGLPGTEFECPNLVRFAVGNTTKDVLFISVNPGAPLGGSGTFYLVGRFDGVRFTSESARPTLYDFAKDNYASQWFSGLPTGRAPVSIAWASNWNYTEQVPTGPREGWRGAMALPRVHGLKQVESEWVVTQNPVDGARPVRGERLPSRRVRDGSVDVPFGDGAVGVYFEVVVRSAQRAGTVGFEISGASGESLRGGVAMDSGVFWMDRAGTRLFTQEDNEGYTPRFETSVVANGDGEFRFTGVLDRSVLEVFLDGGWKSGTMVYYATKPLDRLRVTAEGLGNATHVEVDVWGLQSAW